MSRMAKTGSFWRQFAALCRKNWIILWHYRIINIFRCLLLPIGYALFFANAQNFFSFIGVLGPGYIAPLQTLSPSLNGFKLVYVLPTNNATAIALSEELLRRALSSVNRADANIVRVATNALLERQCPTNFNGRSECFAGVLIGGIDPANQSLNYTIRADVGLSNVDVWDHSKDDIQSRLLPLQWAIESNFINMSTGVFPPSPQTWQYTVQTAEELSETNRINYLGGIKDLLVLAFFLDFLGIVYQLPGSMASERSSLLTSHLEAMGCRRSARYISWHLSLSAAYLPAWIGIAIIFQVFVFKATSLGLLIGLYIVTGLGLASWAQLIVIFFKDASTLAAIFTTFLALVFNIIAVFMRISSSGLQMILTFLFPPMFFTFITKALVGWERSNPRQVIRLNRVSPEGDAPVAWLLIIAIVDIFLFPLIAAYVESKIYGVRPPDYVSFWRRIFGRKSVEEADEVPAGTAVKLEHIHKVYNLGLIKRKKDVVAIEDLSFSVPKGEIFCLLGRNGAAKSTTLHTIARLISATGGKIRYADDQCLGIASQKDVLWDELTCEQHVKLWRQIKSSSAHHQSETDLELLQRSDLGPKIKFFSKNLSGGQKRKLQLACALAGGSNLLLLDEITSGLDPLSRRAIWKLISSNRGTATIILTTHFLDEADYLGDHVAILQQPGRLLALNDPVGLKTQIGKGFVLSVDVPTEGPPVHLGDLGPGLSESETKGKKLYFTGTTDYAPIRRLVGQLERQRASGRDIRYQVNSATLEQVFLDLNAEKEVGVSASNTLTTLSPGPKGEIELLPLESSKSSSDGADIDLEKSSRTVASEKDLEASNAYPPTNTPVLLALSPGRKRNAFLATPIDATTIFVKRAMVFRRAWVLPLIGLVVTIAAATIPLGYMTGRVQTCQLVLTNRRLQRLSYPYSIYPVAFSPVVIAPSTLLSQYPAVLPIVRRVNDNATFVSVISDTAANTSYGGISMSSDPATIPSLWAYEASPFLQKGQSVLNLLSNQLLNSISPPNITGLGIGQVNRLFRIDLSFRFMAAPDFSSTVLAIKWLGFFGLGMAVWPAFAVIYPTQEKASNVRANQYSNGASPVALWLGHLLWELPPIITISSIITIIFATVSTQFNAIGYVWFCLVLYGISSTLYSFMFALFLTSPLASWAVVAGGNVILFLLYLASYLLILTYDRSASAAYHISLAHYTISLICPVPSIVRAILVSINMFNLLCDGLGDYSSDPLSSISQFGGPITYMIIQSLFAFAILVYVDSGSPLPAFLYRSRLKGVAHDPDDTRSADVIEEKDRLLAGAPDMLQVLGLKKRYGGAKQLAVNDVSFGVETGVNFALIGPNGAGKTTTLAVIRGVELPTAGDVHVSGHSIVNSRNGARAQLGVCPQMNTIDQHLTVSQHLWVYGRLKGVPRKLLKQDIYALLAAAGLLPKADQLATSLSGGNQRKLGLAVALIGDRPVVLIDEFSSGVDPFSKREAWNTLAALTKDRAVVMTTHSMEEVDALSTRVGIIASKMLAVGTPSSLKSRFATYEIHLPASQVRPVLEYLHERGCGEAVPSLDTLTRISVPGVREEEVGRLLGVLEGVKGDLGVDVTLHEASTETAFLSIVREHNVREEESRQASGSSWFANLFRRRQKG